MAPFYREYQLVWTQKKSSWFGEPRCKLGSKARSNSRIQFASNESKIVPRNLDPRSPSKVGLRLWYHSRRWVLGLRMWLIGIGFKTVFWPVWGRYTPVMGRYLEYSDIRPGYQARYHPWYSMDIILGDIWVDIRFVGYHLCDILFFNIQGLC